MDVDGSGSLDIAEFQNVCKSVIRDHMSGVRRDEKLKKEKADAERQREMEETSIIICQWYHAAASDLKQRFLRALIADGFEAALCAIDN